MNLNLNTNMKMNRNRPRTSGFTLLEIMIVVSIISCLLAIAIPRFVRARSVSHQTTCINNLRQIRGAITQWALETKAGGTTSVQFADIQGYLRGSVIFTTNLEFPRWTEVFGDPQLTGALLDRITHQCHIIECHGDSPVAMHGIAIIASNKA